MGYGAVRYAPLFCLRFRLNIPTRQAEALLRRYRGFEEIRTLPDQLRWCRCRAGRTQKETAECIGVSRTVYADLERGASDHCPPALADRLSALYGVPVERLLDGYSLFLYRGQPRQLRALRERSGLSRKAFARRAGVSPGSLRSWEEGRKQMSRASWERCFGPSFGDGRRESP